MKKLLVVLLPLLMAGCAADHPVVDKTTVSFTQCPLVARAGGSTGKTDYVCERLSCDNETLTFSCDFVNTSNETQPGVSARIGFYSEVTNHEVLHSKTIFANSLQPGQTDHRVLNWNRAEVTPKCGASLEKCVFLVDRIWPK